MSSKNGLQSFAYGLNAIARRGDGLSPTDAFLVQCHAIDWIGKVPFRRALSDPVGQWIAATWRDVLDNKGFRLRMPARYGPAIAEALRSDGKNLRRAGRVLLAAEDATRAELSPEIRGILEAAN